MERPGPAASLALLVALAIVPPALAAGCTLLLVEPACLVGCHASASVGAPAGVPSGVASAGSAP